MILDEIIIRKATDADITRVMPVVIATREYHANLNELDRLKDGWQEMWSGYALQIVNGKGWMYVAEKDEEVIGYIMGNPQGQPPIFEIDKTAYISDLFVDPRFRNAGVGKMLFDSFKEQVASEGYSHMTLRYAANNDLGAGFWERMGFKIDSIAASQRL
ncbi:MAG: GNAT family N-acetyltransferase [Candidatus Woesearchaeota archaeon]|nr:GNAT family N-acetyltransferase [Candidatus Woesearchaeota archaeon]